ncbi:unnamed protein product [Rangifer tarandus platyrhynchus]|uniref:Uncharacterized protein n=1 Tax=Rangifer tarandus platyrhynchus TaxID=3082113 RepID=A0ABN8XZ38_RANTA|nr:unnamed protein product [Rangifer tarandus platyrhynchus]
MKISESEGHHGWARNREPGLGLALPPPTGEATSGDRRGGRGQGCPSISLQQGASALRGEAALQSCCGRRADWGLRETALGRARAFRSLKTLHLVQKGELRLRKRVGG